MIFFKGLISIYLRLNTLVMKNVLLIFCITLISTASFSQKQEKQNAPKVEEKKVTKKESVQLKPAKKVIKSPAQKKVEVKAVRKKEAAQREDD